MAAKSKTLSIIDSGLTVKGTVNAEGKLVIAGDVEGTLVGSNVVTSQGSHVVAQAEVEEIVIAGDYRGDITASKSIKILRTGSFAGNIVCHTLSLEAGGTLNGHVEPIESNQTVPLPSTGTAGTEDGT
jgi:cytoskeletal protein CcmA (bactofilin family)